MSQDSLYYDEPILQRKKQLIQNPMYSKKYTLGCITIYPGCIEKHSAYGGENPPQCLVCCIIVQISCTMVF